MIKKLEWRQITCNHDQDSVYIAPIPGGHLLKIYPEGGSCIVLSVPAISEKEGNRADFKAWLESERRRESERFNTVTNDQPAIDVADPDAM